MLNWFGAKTEELTSLKHHWQCFAAEGWPSSNYPRCSDESPNELKHGLTGVPSMLPTVLQNRFGSSKGEILQSE